MVMQRTSMTTDEARLLLGETGKPLTDKQIEQDLLLLGSLADAFLDLVVKDTTTRVAKSAINLTKADE